MPAKVTNEILAVKLDAVLQTLTEHREEFKKHVQKDETVAATVIGLEQLSASRTWQLRTIWSTIVTAIVALIFSHFNNR